MGSGLGEYAVDPAKCQNAANARNVSWRSFMRNCGREADTRVIEAIGTSQRYIA
jgi:hypothetical protein